MTIEDFISELKRGYELNIQALKQQHEKEIKEIREQAGKEIQELNDIIFETESKFYKANQKIKQIRSHEMDLENKIGELEDKIEDLKKKFLIEAKSKKQRDLTKIAISELIQDLTVNEIIDLLALLRSDKRYAFRQVISDFVANNSILKKVNR